MEGTHAAHRYIVSQKHRGYETMGFFGSQRGEKSSHSNNISRIQQIDTLNTRLEKARQIVTEGRIFPILNKAGHYVVQAPQGKGFYLVNSEGCCTDGQQHIDLLEGYCEHRMAVDVLNEAQEAVTVSTSQREPKERVMATTNVMDASPYKEPPATSRKGKARVTRSRKTAAGASISTVGQLQPSDSPLAPNDGVHSSDPGTKPR